jgi:hypothetical protein
MGFVQRVLSGDQNRWYNVQNIFLIAGVLGAIFYWFTRGY